MENKMLNFSDSDIKSLTIRTTEMYSLDALWHFKQKGKG